jgi:hypothetical protein
MAIFYDTMQLLAKNIIYVIVPFDAGIGSDLRLLGSILHTFSPVLILQIPFNSEMAILNCRYRYLELDVFHCHFQYAFHL